MHKSLPFVLALGIVGTAITGWYHVSPIKKILVPPPVSTQVERLAPIAKPVVQVKAPKAVVKAAKQVKPQKKQPTRAPARARTEGRDFATDLRKLKDCSILRDLRASGKEASGVYEQKLKWALVPWFLSHCGVS